MTYYNEFDPNAAAWLRELIARGLIPSGEVDERSIIDVKPHELHGFTQHHFFAGIGGWALALRLAGWDDDRPVRTGSCPCQPFSQCGSQKAEADERHLWPYLRDIIAFGQPTVTFGEQVASRLGREWLSGIRVDLEGLGYEVGSADLCAASEHAPDIRQRLFWVANPSRQQRDRDRDRDSRRGRGESPDSRTTRWLADEPSHRWGQERQNRRGSNEGDSEKGSPSRLGLCGTNSGVVHPDGDGCQQGDLTAASSRHRDPAHTAGFWSDTQWILCRDGKHRRIPTKPALFPLADGLPYKLARRRSIRPALLKGSGNAIVPQVAATFIQAFLTA